MQLPSLRQLQYLASLYEHQHFGRAADACHVSQSTLSAGLKELETVLDMRLVERSRRVVVFTPLGVSVVRRAQDLLLRARDLCLVGVSPLAGALRISIIPTIAPFLLPRILPAIRAAHPELEFQVHEEMSHEGCAGLSRGARDCMILALPYECGEFEVATLFEDPILVAARADDPLMQAPVVDPSDLPDERLLFLQEGHCLRDHALKVCRRADQRSGSAPGASIYTLVQLVDAGLGVTMLPQIAVDSGIMSGTQVITRPLAGGETGRVVSLAWRRNSPRAEGFALLAMTIRDICARQGIASGAYPPAEAVIGSVDQSS
ncbi:MAG TPA: hydrogen peroxide-inducible genes activator [Caulobacteraceae bacterium]